MSVFTTLALSTTTPFGSGFHLQLGAIYCLRFLHLHYVGRHQSVRHHVTSQDALQFGFVFRLEQISGSKHGERHEGSEFLYIFEVSLGITFQDEEHVLRAGDSVYFDCSEPHAYSGMGIGCPRHRDHGASASVSVSRALSA